MHDGGGYLDRWEESITFMGSKSVKRSQGKTHGDYVDINMEFWFYPSGNGRATSVLHWETNNQMWKLWEAHPDGYIKNGQETRSG